MLLKLKTPEVVKEATSFCRRVIAPNVEKLEGNSTVRPAPASVCMLGKVAVSKLYEPLAAIINVPVAPTVTEEKTALPRKYTLDPAVSVQLVRFQAVASK